MDSYLHPFPCIGDKNVSSQGKMHDHSTKELQLERKSSYSIQREECKRISATDRALTFSIWNNILSRWYASLWVLRCTVFLGDKKKRFAQRESAAGGTSRPLTKRNTPRYKSVVLLSGRYEACVKRSQALFNTVCFQ